MASRSGFDREAGNQLSLAVLRNFGGEGCLSYQQGPPPVLGGHRVDRGSTRT